MRRYVLYIALAGALASCSDETPGPSAPPPPGCDVGWTSTCWNDTSISTPEAQTACTNELGTWVETGCPGMDAVGMCVETSGRITYYYAPTFATHEADAACSGSFVPMGARVTASCDLRSSPYFGFCIQGSGTESDVDPEGTSMFCAILDGTFSTDPCPVGTGTCSFLDSGVQVKYRYYQGETATDADCVGTGQTWTNP